MLEENFQRLIEILLKKNVPSMVSFGTVTKISSDKQYCTVERENAPTLYKVRLNAIIGQIDSNLTIIPKVGSTVLFSLIDNDCNEAFILSSSCPEEIDIKIENTSLSIKKDQVLINEGSNGGLIKINDLISELGKLSNRVDTIFTGFSKLIPDSPGAGSAGLTAALKAIIASDKENFSNIENSKVKH